MNYPAAELRGINVIPVKTGIQRSKELDSPNKSGQARSKDCGNDGQRKRLLTPKQSFEEFFVLNEKIAVTENTLQDQ